MSKRLVFSIFTLALGFALLACSTSKAPAEAAIQGTEEALAGISEEASQYVPDQLKEIEDTLAAAKESFAKGDYKQALAGAKDLAGKAGDLSAAVAAKKDELTKSWQDMSGGLPGMVEAIQSRMNVLSKSRRLPSGIDKDKFESAKASLAEVTQTWTDATNAYQGGNLADAVAKANDVKGKAVEIMNAIGMKVPEAAAQ